VYETEVRTEVTIPMRDGIRLSANVFLPKAQGKFPVILLRSPYGKDDVSELGNVSFHVARGYVVVSQDCRGRGTSEGLWEPFVNEAADGQDTHKWILAQPWCNGVIGTTGGSYLGFTQWISSPGAGEYLRGMVTLVPLVDPYGDAMYNGGAFNLALMMGWGSIMSWPPREGMPLATWDAERWRRAYRTLPLSQWDQAIGREVPYLRQWVAHPHYDGYWAARSVRNHWQEITTPILAVGGWYDIFAQSTLDHVNAVRKFSGSSRTRAQQHVLMGPWTHGISSDGKVGDLDFGRTAVLNLRDLHAQWFDYCLKGERNTMDQFPALRIFVMGRNVWRDERAWPLERTRWTKYYLHSEGAANTLSGNGELSTDAAGDELPDRFTYDPNDPVPTLGGNNLYGCPAGPRDHTQAEQRSDVLVYTSKALPTDLEVTGPVRAVLFAASSAPDTDWTAKLLDVHADGRAFNLCDGIVRASHRESPGRPLRARAQEVYRYEIDLAVTSNVFLAGHKIRVEVSSSNFPRFDRNLNTGEPFGAGTTWITATQTIYHDEKHPSHILMPVIR
jgi:putative CocE/NonD family hydrolase